MNIPRLNPAGRAKVSQRGLAERRRSLANRRLRTRSSPSLSQLNLYFVERGTLVLKKLQRSRVIVLYPWNEQPNEIVEHKPARKERPNGMKLARHYQALLDTGKFESRAALANYLGVSRARVTQVLKRIHSLGADNGKEPKAG